jgi:hypothetical protein
MTEYDGPNISAVCFKMNTNGQAMGFKMPCNWRAVRQIFKEDPSIRNTKLNSDEQAIRVTWRIIHTWVKSQLALVEVNMVRYHGSFCLTQSCGTGGRLRNTSRPTPPYKSIKSKT